MGGKKLECFFFIFRFSYLPVGLAKCQAPVVLMVDDTIQWMSVDKTNHCYHKPCYYIDTSVLLENTPLVKFIRNHIRDSSGIFSISSLVRISMLSLISSLSLKLYLISLVYDRNIFGSSSKVFGNLRQSLVIFGNLQKFLEMFGNVRATFGQIFENLWKSSENHQLCRH